MADEITFGPVDTPTEVDHETVTDQVDTDRRPIDPTPMEVSWIDGIKAPQARPPILPAWLMSADQRAMALRWAVEYSGYVACRELVRLPLYAGRVLRWAPVGLGRLIYRLVRWARGGAEVLDLRKAMSVSRESGAWVALDNRRQKEAKGRPLTLALGALALVGAEVAAHLLAPTALMALADLGTAITLARLGRPADRPILDWTSNAGKMTRLTANMLREALCNIGVSKIKDHGQIKFPQEIHRDGPGWLARINLPLGVLATDVMERRGRLSSALRLPVDQVWLTPGPDHEGQIDIWVGYKPASQMGQPAWSLTAASARTSVFEPVEFGTDERQRPITTSLFARNFLIGGVPGSGKSYAARCLALAAALDPTVELKIAEFKGTADFGDLAPFCSDYACGVDDSAFAVGLRILAWGVAEAERRGKRIRAARERGEAPEGKVTPELARKPGGGLHPILILIDEAHELFGDESVGKEAAQQAERLIKRGRALGIIVVLATQIPDKNSLPPIITRCVNVRWCLAVQDQIANDMILGTGAYKRGVTATVYRPGYDAGWGMMIGLAKPGAVRSHYPDEAQTAGILARIAQLRGMATVGSTAQVETRDVVSDLLSTLRPDEVAAHWAVAVSRLQVLDLEYYGAWTVDTLRDYLRKFDVPSINVKAVDLDGNRRVCKGFRRDSLTEHLIGVEGE